MPNTIFKDSAQAKASLLANKFEYTEWVKGEAKTVTFARKKDFIDSYAEVAAFLCNKPEFITALNEVSSLLWDAYRGLSADTRNKFTRALGVVAATKGFAFQSRLPLNTAKPPIGIKLIGGDPQLGYMLRGRLFWKDSMDLRHGEHSHSLQWLAIAQGLPNLKVPAAELYSKTGNFRAQSKDDQPGQRSLLMWQWLTDCFPCDMNNLATATFLNGETLESNTFRAPQFLTDYLLKRGTPIPGNFVSTYLFHRYKNRSWLSTKEVYNDKKNKMETRIDKIYDGQAYSGKGANNWTPSDNVSARLLRNKNYVGTHATQPKHSYDIKLHGKQGTLCFHS